MSTEKRLQTLNRKLIPLETELDVVEETLKQRRSDLKEAKDYKEAALRSRHILQTIAKQIQTNTHQSIARLVSMCLEGIFDEPYFFKIDFVERRGRTEAELSFEREGQKMSPLDATGGGVVDVAAFALRLASLLLAKPKGRRVLILDEPFKFVSADYHERIADLLESLSDELEVQFIIVTHINDLKLGKVVKL